MVPECMTARFMSKKSHSTTEPNHLFQFNARYEEKGLVRSQEYLFFINLMAGKSGFPRCKRFHVLSSDMATGKATRSCVKSGLCNIKEVRSVFSVQVWETRITFSPPDSALSRWFVGSDKIVTIIQSHL